MGVNNKSVSLRAKRTISGQSLETLDIEYEWKRLRCATCKTFVHNDHICPKSEIPVDKPFVDDEGFIDVD